MKARYTTFPIDIVFSHILPRLPVNSLLRFKVVSKSFKTEISSPEFIKTQHVHAMSSDDNLLLFVSLGTDSAFSIIDVDTPNALPSVCHYSKPVVPQDLMDYEVVVASCECYLLIESDSTVRKSLMLLNPATRTYREIPYDVFEHCGRVRYGMCHCADDEFNDDYKVVYFVEFADFDGFKRQVSVYSLRNNSLKIVECNHTDETYSYDTDVLLQIHLLHLIFYTKNEAVVTRIGCFDIKAERWANDVPLPDMLLSEDGPKLTRQLTFRIGSLNGKLCIMSGDVKCSTYDLWVMKEYGVKESWVKLMSLPTPNGVEEHYKFRHIMYRPFAYRKGSRHEVLCRRVTGEYFWYNVKNKEVIEAEFKIPRFNHQCCYSYVCKGSLLNFPGSQQLPISSESEPIKKKTTTRKKTISQTYTSVRFQEANHFH